MLLGDIERLSDALEQVNATLSKEPGFAPKTPIETQLVERRKLALTEGVSTRDVRWLHELPEVPKALKATLNQEDFSREKSMLGVNQIVDIIDEVLSCLNQS